MHVGIRATSAALCGAATLAMIAGCGTDAPGAASSPTASPAPPSAPVAAPPTATSDPQQALKDHFPDLMRSFGFFPSTPDNLIDADGNAVCGNLATEPKAAVLSYEYGVDETPATGMTTHDDIQRFVNAAISAFCPQYVGR